MKIFIDSADINEIKKYLSWGVCDGVTTNPTIFLKCFTIEGIKMDKQKMMEIARLMTPQPVSFGTTTKDQEAILKQAEEYARGVTTKGIDAVKQRAADIAELIAPRPLSVEVSSDEPEEVLRQAREYAKLAENISVKVTITDSQGNSLLPVVHQLIKEGVSINVTAMMTFNQAILAAKAVDAACPKRINFISIFAGRISEEHGVEQAFKVIKDVRTWLDFHHLKNIEIIVGSVRSPENVELWARAGAHILTIPPEVIAKSLQAARTKETVRQFIDDAKKSMEQLK